MKLWVKMPLLERNTHHLLRSAPQIQRISRKRSSYLKENRKNMPVNVAACRVDSSQVLWIANIIGTVREID